MREADALAFPLSLLSGDRCRRSTVGQATERVIGAGDLICIDAGIVLDGFYADCTRMTRCNAGADRDYQALVEAHHEVIAALRPGVPFNQIGEYYGRALRTRGLPAETLELADLGHGIGLALHESPFFVTSSSADMTIEEGMVFTLEPEIAFPDKRLRVEDMVVAGAAGLRVLTNRS